MIGEPLVLRVVALAVGGKVGVQPGNRAGLDGIDRGVRGQPGLKPGDVDALLRVERFVGSQAAIQSRDSPGLHRVDPAAFAARPA